MVQHKWITSLTSIAMGLIVYVLAIVKVSIIQEHNNWPSDCSYTAIGWHFEMPAICIIITSNLNVLLCSCTVVYEQMLENWLFIFRHQNYLNLKGPYPRYPLMCAIVLSRLMTIQKRTIQIKHHIVTYKQVQRIYLYFLLYTESDLYHFQINTAMKSFL